MFFIVAALAFVIGALVAHGIASSYYREDGRIKDGEITALKVGKADINARLIAAFEQMQEWRRVAVGESIRVRELTDRLLKVAKVPSLDAGGDDPPTVGESDRKAAEEARAELERTRTAKPKGDLEPVAVSDDEVPPVARMTADVEDDEENEDTSFAGRMRD